MPIKAEFYQKEGGVMLHKEDSLNGFHIKTNTRFAQKGRIHQIPIRGDLFHTGNEGKIFKPED